MTRPMTIQTGEICREHAAVPERREGADDQQEVADQIQMNESHPNLFPDARQAGVRVRRSASDTGWPWQCARDHPVLMRYRCKRTTSAARRLSRRVSSRALSCFGRSSP